MEKIARKGQGVSILIMLDSALEVRLVFRDEFVEAGFNPNYAG